MTDIIRIIIKGGSGYGPVDEAYNDKVAIDRDSIRYEYKPVVESENNPPRKWSYKTSSSIYQKRFREAAAANYGQLFAGKPACAVATCWRAGATPSIDRINKYFTFSQMPVVSSEYWNGYLGPQDSFGIGVLKTLAANMADLLRKE